MMDRQIERVRKSQTLHSGMFDLELLILNKQCKLGKSNIFPS